ncbi:MAG TPA: ABC transporter ATP-binding protein [Planctomycetota bacterium]|nr:ABC transporter ATP-binding protein [Planctomycetota bacterium]
MGNILDITDLSVRYPDGTTGLDGVSLSVPAGGRVGLIGPNGAGKTSLMLGVMGALKFTGQVVVDGIALSRRTVDEVRSRCGMVFQNPDDQLFMPTLLDDVAFGPLNQGCTPEEAEARSREAITSVGLFGLEKKAAHHLSGGQKRNASLATILSMRVKLLLLDEPGAGLDFRSRRRLLEILATRGEAFLLAAHDLGLVRDVCTEVVLLDDGRVVTSGAVERVLDDPKLLAAHGLG